MTPWAAATVLAALLSAHAACAADPVRLVPYPDLEARLVTRIDFEGFPRRLSPGMALEGVQALDGAALGERFAGQRLWQEAGFDRLTPFATPPLSIQAGAQRENLSVTLVPALSNLLWGLAPPGWPAVEAGGEGAIAVLFDRDQWGLGFRVAADPEPEAAATMRVAFFRRDATLVADLAVALVPGWAAYGFARDGERADIAGIVLTNDDPEGIAIDDLIFDSDLTFSRRD